MSKIPPIPPIPTAIKTAASKGRLIIFIGAGASRILGCPSWKELAEKYLDAIRDAGKINHFVYERLKEVGQRDPRKLLTICKVIMRENGVVKPDLRELLKGSKKKNEKYKIYDYIYSFNAVNITTNFDEHLDNVLKSQQSLMESRVYSVTGPAAANATTTTITSSSPRAQIFYKEADLLSSTLITNGNIIHLHGSVEDQNSLIITFPEYAKHYERGSKASVFLEEAFKKTVLFIGYGLEDYEVLEYIVQKAGVANGEIRHAMLFAAFEEEEAFVEQLDKYYRHLGIQLVSYSKSINGHEQLVEVLRQWSVEIRSIAEPPGFIDVSKMIDEVT